MRFGSTHFLAVAALVGLSTAASPLFAAGDEGEADAQIQQMTVELKELGVKDGRNAATSELGQAEALVAKARSIIGERKERDALGRTLEEAAATLSLAEAKIIEADKQAMLDEQKQILAETETELAGTRDKVAELETVQAELDEKLGGGK